MAKTKEKSISIFARPWFVVAIVCSCFAVLTPKIFLPLFRQLLGFGREDEKVSANNDRFPPPNLRQRNPPASADGGSEYPRAGPQFGRPPPTYSPQSSSGSGRSLLTFLLPVYAIGIGLYMVYTLCKVFNKNGDEDKKNEDDESDDEIKKTLKFKERSLDANVQWDPDEGEFKYKRNASHFVRSEESEDELNDYERYRNLDPDYVAYLKEMRRRKREEAMGSKAVVNLREASEIELTPNTGLTSITNTNVLMNDTLERMKSSLNKINIQLSEVEKKGGPLDDPELDSLRLQLTQTELQMAKIMNIVNTVSNTIQNENVKYSKSMRRNNNDSDEDDLSRDDDDDEDFSNNSDSDCQKNMKKINKKKKNKKKQRNSDEEYVDRNSYSKNDQEEISFRQRKGKKIVKIENSSLSSSLESLKGSSDSEANRQSYIESLSPNECKKQVVDEQKNTKQNNAPNKTNVNVNQNSQTTSKKNKNKNKKKKSKAK